MYFRKTLIVCVSVIAMTVTLPNVVAQESAKIDKLYFEHLLGDRVVQGVDRNPESYLKRYTQQLYRIAENGVLTQKRYEQYQLSTHSIARAKMMVELLSADIDGNGVVTQEEFSSLISNGSRGFNRANAALQFLEADTNRDQQVTFAEMSAKADETIRSKKNNKRYNRRSFVDLMVFDINQDGSVDVSEISKGVDIISGKSACESVCQ